MYYVYVLKSLTARRSYVGCTSDLEKRLRAHNQKQVKATKRDTPFVLIHKEEFIRLKDARKKELFYKTTSGRRTLKKIFKQIEKCPPRGHEGACCGETPRRGQLRREYSAGEVPEWPKGAAC